MVPWQLAAILPVEKWGWPLTWDVHRCALQSFPWQSSSFWFCYATCMCMHQQSINFTVTHHQPQGPDKLDYRRVPLNTTQRHTVCRSLYLAFLESRSAQFLHFRRSEHRAECVWSNIKSHSRTLSINSSMPNLSANGEARKPQKSHRGTMTI